MNVRAILILSHLVGKKVRSEGSHLLPSNEINLLYQLIKLHTPKNSNIFRGHTSRFKTSYISIYVIVLVI